MVYPSIIDFSDALYPGYINRRGEVIIFLTVKLLIMKGSDNGTSVSNVLSPI